MARPSLVQNRRRMCRPLMLWVPAAYSAAQEDSGSLEQVPATFGSAWRFILEQPFPSRVGWAAGLALPASLRLRSQSLQNWAAQLPSLRLKQAPRSRRSGLGGSRMPCCAGGPSSGPLCARFGWPTNVDPGRWGALSNCLCSMARGPLDGELQSGAACLVLTRIRRPSARPRGWLVTALASNVSCKPRGSDRPEPWTTQSCRADRVESGWEYWRRNRRPIDPLGPKVWAPQRYRCPPRLADLCAD